MMDRAVLLPVTATMDYLAIARGDVTAIARVNGDIDAARATFDTGSRPEIEISCEITDSAGTITGRVVTRWTLKALKKA
jgi:hypothetical protein